MIADKRADRSISLADEWAIRNSVGEITKQWQSILTQTVSNMFNGSTSSNELLYTLIKDGRALSQEPLVTNDEWENMFDTALYTMLIPQLWQLKGVHPFLVDTNMGCPNGQLPSDPSGSWVIEMMGSIDSFPWYCYEDRVYILATPIPTQVVAGPGHWSSGYIGKLPGASELDGTTWGPLSADDIVLSCLRAYTQNGNKNGWPRANPQDPTTLDTIIQHGTAAAGVWSFPICGANEALDNMRKWKTFGETSKHYPCN